MASKDDLLLLDGDDMDTEVSAEEANKLLDLDIEEEINIKLRETEAERKQLMQALLNVK